MGNLSAEETNMAQDASVPGVRPLNARTALRLALQAPNSYGFVLVLLLVSFILAPLAQGLDALWARVLVQGAVVLFAIHTSRVHRRTLRVAALIVAVSLALSLEAVVTGGTNLTEGHVEALLALLIAISVPAMLRRILTAKEVGADIVLGALDVYILFGMFFAALYASVGGLSSTPFFTTHQQVNAGGYQFFSFITLTTVGYGNLVPATSLGQSLAVLEAVAGQVYLVTLVARLVSAWQPGIRRSALERYLAEREEKEKAARDDSDTSSSLRPGP